MDLKPQKALDKVVIPALLNKKVEQQVYLHRHEAIMSATNLLGRINPLLVKNDALREELTQTLQIIGPDKFPELCEKIVEESEQTISSFINLVNVAQYFNDPAPHQNQNFPITNLDKPERHEIELFRYGILPIDPDVCRELLQKVILRNSRFHKQILGITDDSQISYNDIQDYVIDRITSTLTKTLTKSLASRAEEDENEGENMYAFPRTLSYKIARFYVTARLGPEIALIHNDINGVADIQDEFRSYTETIAEKFYQNNPESGFDNPARNVYNNTSVSIGSNVYESLQAPAKKELKRLFVAKNKAMMAINDHQKGMLNAGGFEKMSQLEIDSTLSKIHSGEVSFEVLDREGVLSSDTAALKPMNDLFGLAVGDSLLSFTSDCFRWLVEHGLKVNGNEISFRYAAAVGGDEFRLYYKASRAIKPEVISMFVMTIFQNLYLHARDYYQKTSAQGVPSLPDIVSSVNGGENLLFSVPFTDGYDAVVKFLGGEKSTALQAAKDKAKSAGIENLQKSFDDIRDAYQHDIQNETTIQTPSLKEITDVSETTVTNLVDNGFVFFNAFGATSLKQVFETVKIVERPGESVRPNIARLANTQADQFSNIAKAELKNILKGKSQLIKLLYKFRAEDTATWHEKVRGIILNIDKILVAPIDQTNFGAAYEILTSYDSLRKKLSDESRTVSHLEAGFLPTPSSVTRLYTNSNAIALLLQKRDKLTDLDDKIKLLQASMDVYKRSRRPTNPLPQS